MRQQTMSQRTFRKRTGELVDEPDRRRRGPTRPKGLSIRDSTGAPTARRTEWPRATVDSLRRYGEENDYSKLVRLLDQIGDGALHLGKPRPRLHRPSQGSGHGWPDTPSIQFVEGNRFEEAEEALRRAIGEDRTNAWSWTLLGVLLRMENRVRESEDALREAVVADEQNAHAKNALARLLLETDGDLAEAEFFASEAASSEASTPSMGQTLALILARQGKWPLAEEAARRFLEAGSDQVPEGLWSDVVTFFREAVAAGRAKEAIALLESVNLGERWRPLKEALEVIARQSPEYLRRIAPEVREPAEALVEELTGEAPDAR